jgi:hypothetical protein
MHLKSSLFDVIDMMNDVTYDEMLKALKRIQKRKMSVLIYKKAKS